ncbi:hypothetical protein Tco_0757779 [Tanacetum coccineum]
MAPVRISSGPEPKKMLDHSSSSLGLQCQKTFDQISSNLVSRMSQRRLLASLQAPFLKDKKGVRFSALYLQQKRNLLVLDHSHQQVAYFFHARSVVKWINVDQLIGKGNLLLDLQKLQKNPIFRISVDIPDDEEMAPVRISSGPEPQMMFGQNSSSLVLHQMMSAQISSGLAPQCIKMFEHSSSSLGLHCQKTFKQISSNLVSQMSQRRLLASLQAPFLKEKKGVRFSALYLQQKRNLLVLDHSHQQVSYFFHARSVVKWINVDQLIRKGNLLLDLQKLQMNPIFRISVDIFVRAFPSLGSIEVTKELLFFCIYIDIVRTQTLLGHSLSSAITIYNKTTRKLPVVEVKGKGSATDVQAAKSLLELHKPKKLMMLHPQDGSVKTSIHADVNLVVGSNSEQSHVALAGSNPEHMHDVFLATNYPKCNRVLERQKKLRNQIFSALTASADVPSNVTETTDTTSTLPPPRPPLQTYSSSRYLDHLKMEMEMEIPSSSNVKLITECSDTTYTCYEVMKDLIKVSKLPQTLISYSSSQVHKMAIDY